jgi:transposase
MGIKTARTGSLTPRLVSREELIVGHKADGRAVYSRNAKAQLIEAATRRGASVAAIARQHDLNANQLHAWIRVAKKRKPQVVSVKQTALLPVIVSNLNDADRVPVLPTSDGVNASERAPIITIHLPRTRIDIIGAVDRTHLSVVLSCLGFRPADAHAHADATPMPSA